MIKTKNEEALKIIVQEGVRAVPSLFDSSRSANDREVTNPRTRKKCKNNPSEIGYLLKHLSEEDRKYLSNFTVKDLELTHERTRLADFILMDDHNKKLKKANKGRWGLK